MNQALLDDADRIVAADLYPARCRRVVANLAATLREQSSDLAESRQYALALEEELRARAERMDQLLLLANSMDADFETYTKAHPVAAIDPAAIREAALREAARLVSARCDAYVAEHGSYDYSTGTTEYPGDGAEWVEEWTDIESAILALISKGAAEPTEYERKVAQMKKDFPNGI